MQTPAYVDPDKDPYPISRLPLSHPHYPALLRTMVDPPPLLHAQGDLRALDKPAVAIVGSRRCSASASALAFDLARDVASRGWCVVSGLARGIDTAAHRGALAAGVPGSTIAVFGTGIDVVYPPENAALARSIVATGGLLLTALAPGSPPLARHFPQRNRIVAGLSRAVVIVQAARASGSMITARLAAELGRDVLAVPGRAGDSLSAGTHDLIRQGAGLLETVDDLWAAFGLYHQSTDQSDKKTR